MTDSPKAGQPQAGVADAPADPNQFSLTINLEELRKKSLFLATPMYGGQCAGIYTRSVLDMAAMCANYGIRLQVYYMFNESLITRARNYCVDEFMRSGCTHLMFIDSDIGFNPKDVLALMALSDDSSPYDVIGGPYPKKTISWEKIKLAVDRGAADKNPNDLENFVGDFVFNPKGGANTIPIGKPFEVLEIGTGFMMVRRKTFEDYERAFPELSYKPDHVRTEHFDGSREILAYFDTIIDPETKRYLSEDYMFCMAGKNRIVTSDGLMTIKDLVQQEYSGLVKSISPDGHVEWNRVTGWSRRSNNGKRWVRVNTWSDNRKVGKLYCTADHQIAVVANPLVPSIQFVQADESIGGYVVRDCDGNANINPIYDADGVSFIIGTLLGDATISKAGQMSVAHTAVNADYVEVKKSIFGGSDISVRDNVRGFAGAKPIHSFSLPVNAQTKLLRELAYVDGRKSPINLIPYIDVKALAFLYMDDGCMGTSSASIATYSFTREENEMLASHLYYRFGLECAVSIKKTSGREYPYLRFNADNSRRLYAIVAPYIVDSMLYKIPEEYHLSADERYSYTLKTMEYAASRVTSIEDVRDQGDLYDISVENNHNFVANGTYVHNCYNVQKMGGQVWLCPWMQLQHVGSYVFGGSLAALASVGANATADPAELKKIRENSKNRKK